MMSQALDIDALRETYLNRDFDERNFQLTPAQIVDYASACGETAPRYVDPEHPDFQAPPTFASSFQPGRRLPEGFPQLPGLGMDAGKAVSPRAHPPARSLREDRPLRTHDFHGDAHGGLRPR
jgi:hypothetical protein